MTTHGIRLIDREPNVVRNKPMRVLMLGGPRTGTSSLHDALTILGLRVYHHADLLSDMGKLANDCKLWREAVLARFFNKGNPYDFTEFEKILGNYQAVGDNPMSLFVDDLIKFYPDAKVILTNRDPDSWYISMKKTLFRWYGAPSVRFVAFLDSELLGPVFGCFPLGFDVFTGGDWYNETRAKQKYVEHYEYVRKVVPKERILEFNQPYEWKQLCDFLDLPIPETEYPRSNTASDVDVLYGAITYQRAWMLFRRGAYKSLPLFVGAIAAYFAVKSW